MAGKWPKSGGFTRKYTKNLATLIGNGGHLLEENEELSSKRSTWSRGGDDALTAVCSSSVGGSTCGGGLRPQGTSTRQRCSLMVVRDGSFGDNRDIYIYRERERERDKVQLIRGGDRDFLIGWVLKFEFYEI